jgi:protein tyrosine phosphatase (PTP) superfamily phosphohydrolase (DUF442 family)
MQLDQVRGYLEVTPMIVTAGQPSEAQFRLLPALGFRHVINLGLLDPRYCLADEAGLADSLGVRYVHIPVDFSAPGTLSLQRFFGEMDACGGDKVLVHCAANYRVSCYMALYAQVRWGWSQDRADALISGIWVPDDTWAAFMQAQRGALGLLVGSALDNA